MNSKENLKKIADRKNYTNSDSIINKILQDAKLGIRILVLLSPLLAHGVIYV